MKAVRLRFSSIQSRLQWGFLLASLVLVGSTGLLFERTLSRALEQEEAKVLHAHASVILRRVDRGSVLGTEDDLVLDRSEWQLLDPNGGVLTRSQGWTRLGDFPWPQAGRTTAHRSGSQVYTLATFRWREARGSRNLELRIALDRTHEQGLIMGMRKALLLGVCVAAIAAAVLGRFLSRWGLASLRAITRQAGSIDYHHLHTRLEAQAFPGELQELVHTFNGALDRLQKAFQRLNQLGAELAHEMRTPLQNLRSEVESLILRPPAPNLMQDALGSVLEECDRMASLIEQILLLARSENPGAAIDPRELDAEMFMKSIADPFEALAEDKAITIQVTAPHDLPFRADEGLARRAVGNLIANALRHTPRGGRIILGAHIEGEAVVLWVKDNGEGAPPHLLPRLGQPFQRGQQESLLNARGFGLGLAIVKGIMSLHNGHMQFESEQGQGTTVFLTFPGP